jgi:hypothetical protein
VWGRGDGAMLLPKFTGMAVFVAPVVAPYVRLLGMYKHSFGASEGSKGGVGVALGLYDVTMAFINTHMASKRPELRRAQYQELVDRLGGKLGGRGFGLNESFHHVVWLGDLNVHCSGVSAADAVALIKTGRHMQLLLQHDELLVEKDAESAFYEYEEPLMGPRFYPTYKRLPGRGKVDHADPDWVSKVYVTAYKEPFYKGGRVMERVPAWTDRIQYHSLADRWGELLPEALDPSRPDASIHNYHAVNDAALDTSDHSPIFATFGLQICADEMDEGLEAFVEQQQAQVGYRQADTGAEDGDGGGGGGGNPSGAGTTTRALPSIGPILDVDLSNLHPSLRPLQVDLTLYGIVVEYKGAIVAPRAASTVFPLPYEDSNEIPDRRKVTRDNGIPFFSRGQDSLAVSMRTVVSRAARLESLHLLLKVSLDDNTKAQCVICFKDGGFVGAGTHINRFLQPLTTNGVPFKVNGKPVTVQFTMEMNAYERGGTQQTVPAAPVTSRGHAAVGLKRVASPSAASQQQQQQQQQSGAGGAFEGSTGATAAAAAMNAAAGPVPIAPRPPVAPPASVQGGAGASSVASTPARPPMSARPGVAANMAGAGASNAGTNSSASFYSATPAGGAPSVSRPGVSVSGAPSPGMMSAAAAAATPGQADAAAPPTAPARAASGGRWWEAAAPPGASPATRTTTIEFGGERGEKKGDIGRRLLNTIESPPFPPPLMPSPPASPGPRASRRTCGCRGASWRRS